MKAAWAAALAVIALFIFLGRIATEDGGRAAADQNYNRLAEGIRRGQLSLAKEAPAGLLALPDPYDPDRNAPFRYGIDHLHDVGLYQGKLYLYFGPTPLLLLFPWSILTGHYLSDATTVVIFSAVGVLLTTALLITLRRRFFPNAPSGSLAIVTWVVTLTSGLPMLLQHPGMHEIPIACSYAFVAGSLLCLLRSCCGADELEGKANDPRHPLGDAPPRLSEPGAGGRHRRNRQDDAAAEHQPGDSALGHAEQRKCEGRSHRMSSGWSARLWSAGAGLCFGLAVAARPSLLPGAILFPIFYPCWSRRGVRRLAAWAVPLGVCIVALLCYNQARFHSPFEFGQKYQLAADRQDTAHHFSFSYLPYNFRVYFANPANSTLPPPPSGHAAPEDPFGLLPNLPFVLLALAAPLALPLRRLSRALLALFLAALAPLALFYGTCSRYEIDFLPPLILLAAVGVLALEAGAGRYRAAARSIWLTLGAISLFLMGAITLRRHAQELYNLATSLDQSGHPAESLPYFASALNAYPEYAEAEQNLATAYVHLDRLPEAITHYQAALRLNPNSAPAHFDLGIILYQAHRPAEAAREFRAALRLDPGFQSAQADLKALEAQGF